MTRHKICHIGTPGQDIKLFCPFSYSKKIPERAFLAGALAGVVVVTTCLHCCFMPFGFLRAEPCPLSSVSRPLPKARPERGGVSVQRRRVVSEEVSVSSEETYGP